MVEHAETWAAALIIGGAVVMIVLWVSERLDPNTGLWQRRSFFDFARGWKRAVFYLGMLSAVAGVFLLFQALPDVGPPEAGDPCSAGKPPPPGFECR